MRERSDIEVERTAQCLRLAYESVRSTEALAKPSPCRRSTQRLSGQCDVGVLKKPLTAYASLLAILAGSPAEPEVRSFDSDGVKIAYRVDGGGPPVILIHGLTVDADLIWRTPGITEKLAKKFQVISMDVRGHGQSGKPHDRSAYGLQLVEDVARLMDHLHFDRAHIVGYSMGGEIAVKLVALYPRRVLSAVIGGAGWLRESSPSYTTYVNFADKLSAIRPGDSLVETMGGLPDFSDAYREIIERNDPRALVALMDGMLALEVSEKELRANHVPTLAVAGENDDLRRDIDALGNVMSNLSMQIISGQTHDSAIGDPRFVGLIESFLTRSSDSAR